MERQELEDAVQRGLSTPERRVLILLYDQEFTPAEVAALAAADPNLGLTGITEVTREDE